MHFDTALGIAAKIHGGETTSVAVTEMMLARIKALDPGLKAYITLCEEQALQAAAQADAELAQSGPRSPLHGVPIAIKDLLDTEGVETTYGMRIHRGRIPDKDATVVARLRAAGCVMLGKLKLTEGAYARHHPDFEVPVNPWNRDCWTGVSSSGSGVATAAGLCFASIGTDTGGSIRFPSAANGIVGLKPTWGRVSRAGVLPLAYTLDHIGPMTRSVKDAAAMLSIIAGVDADDPTTSRLPVVDYLQSAEGDVRGLTIGVDWRFAGENLDPEVAGAVKDAVARLESAGATIREVTIPWEAVARGWPITCAVEAAHAHRDTFPARRADYGPIADLLELGGALPAAAYMEVELARREFKAALNGVFQQADVIICPSMSFAAIAKEGSPEADEAEQDLAQTLRFTAPFDYSGSPTLSIPWAPGEKGVPLSIQLVARDFQEDLLVNAGVALEALGGYANNHPDLP